VSDRATFFWLSYRRKSRSMPHYLWLYSSNAISSVVSIQSRRASRELKNIRSEHTKLCLTTEFLARGPKWRRSSIQELEAGIGARNSSQEFKQSHHPSVDRETAAQALVQPTAKSDSSTGSYLAALGTKPEPHGDSKLVELLPIRSKTTR
jgi:hypothetical protein